MNRRGLTLVEVLVAGALWLTVISSFACFIKIAAQRATATEKISQALYEARSRMEELLSRPASVELEMVIVDVPPVRLYSLRSKY